MTTKTKAAAKPKAPVKAKAAADNKVTAKLSTPGTPKAVAKAPPKEKAAAKPKASAKPKVAATPKAAPKAKTKPKVAAKAKATASVRNVKKFDALKSQDFTISDNSGVIGQVRVKPNAVAWKPKRGKAFHQISLEQLAAFASEHGREVQN